jgi:DnaJ family protein C protein 3
LQEILIKILIFNLKILIEKRQRFDNGEDPLDPDQQNQGGGHPFHHQGFNPFGHGFNGGNFQFKFKF